MLGGKVREIPGYALTPPIRIMVGTRLPLCRTISVPPPVPPDAPPPLQDLPEAAAMQASLGPPPDI